jgi:hypothetical protein
VSWELAEEEQSNRAASRADVRSGGIGEFRGQIVSNQTAETRWNPRKMRRIRSPECSSDDKQGKSTADLKKVPEFSEKAQIQPVFIGVFPFQCPNPEFGRLQSTPEDSRSIPP